MSHNWNILHVWQLVEHVIARDESWYWFQEPSVKKIVFSSKWALSDVIKPARPRLSWRKQKYPPHTHKRKFIHGCKSNLLQVQKSLRRITHFYLYLAFENIIKSKLGLQTLENNVSSNVIKKMFLKTFLTKYPIQFLKLLFLTFLKYGSVVVLDLPYISYFLSVVFLNSINTSSRIEYSLDFWKSNPCILMNPETFLFFFFSK